MPEQQITELHTVVSQTAKDYFNRLESCRSVAQIVPIVTEFKGKGLSLKDEQFLLCYADVQKINLEEEKELSDLERSVQVGTINYYVQQLLQCKNPESVLAFKNALNKAALDADSKAILLQLAKIQILQFVSKDKNLTLSEEGLAFLKERRTKGIFSGTTSEWVYQVLKSPDNIQNLRGKSLLSSLVDENTKALTKISTYYARKNILKEKSSNSIMALENGRYNLSPEQESSALQGIDNYAHQLVHCRDIQTLMTIHNDLLTDPDTESRRVLIEFVKIRLLELKVEERTPISSKAERAVLATITYSYLLKLDNWFDRCYTQICNNDLLDAQVTLNILRPGYARALAEISPYYAGICTRRESFMGEFIQMIRQCRTTGVTSDPVSEEDDRMNLRFT